METLLNEDREKGIEKEDKDNGLGKRLRKLRLDRDVTIAEVSEKTKLSDSAIRSYEEGSCQPILSSICKLADYYNVSIDYLAGRVNLRRLPSKACLTGLQTLLKDLACALEELKVKADERE